MARLKLFLALLALLFVFTSCIENNEEVATKNKSISHSKSTLSSKDKTIYSSKVDSLRKLFDKQKNPKYLNEALTIAKDIKNDTLLGLVYADLAGNFTDNTDFQLMDEYYYKSNIIFSKYNLYKNLVVNYSNLSWSFIQANDFSKGVYYGQKGKLLLSKIKNDSTRNTVSCLLYNNLSIAYLGINQIDSALIYNDLALSYYPNVKELDPYVYSFIYGHYGEIYEKYNDFQKAQFYYLSSLFISNLDTSNIKTNGATLYILGKFCKFLNSQKKYNDAIKFGRYGLKIVNLEFDKRYFIDLTNELSCSYDKLSKVDSAFKYSKLSAKLKEEVFNQSKSIQLQNYSFNRELKEKENQYALDKANTEGKLRNEKQLRYVFIFGLIAVLIFAIILFYQRNKIKSEKNRSDELLLNILPSEVAEELKEKGSAEAKLIDEVTVMFTDFKGFTQLSEKLTPNELVHEINECFSAFDLIMEKYGVEKIKTIGDAYMAVGGLPTANNTHAFDVICAAMEVLEFMDNHKSKSIQLNKPIFEIRIGIHSGPVVAGIVGVKKFAYDIWGDTVNIANRMENSGEVSKVNISGTTYEIIKDKFKCIHRGKIPVKGKADIDMYFVEDRI